MVEAVPSLLTRILLGVVVVAVVALALIFQRAQNRKQAGSSKMGGAISPPKMLWLAWAVGVWLFVVPVVALDPGVAPALRWTLGIFAAWMWLRGIAELVMMYVTKNWRPPYGIAHDVSCVVLLVALCVAQLDAMSGLSGYDLWVLALVIVVTASMVIETIYAVRFHEVVEGKTTGDDAVWFADPDDPKFKRINRLTTILNVPLYAFIAVFVAVSAFRSG